MVRGTQRHARPQVSSASLPAEEPRSATVSRGLQPQATYVLTLPPARWHTRTCQATVVGARPPPGVG